MDKKHFDIDFRAATLKDFEECMDLINQARQQMIESGLHQWTGGCPEIYIEMFFVHLLYFYGYDFIVFSLQN